jgi:hypothetical protein
MAARTPQKARPAKVTRFRQSADFKPFLEATQPFSKDIEGMTHYEVTAGVLAASVARATRAKSR